LQKARLGLLAIVALVALRFTIGYHFYMEGATKVREGNFSSKGFLTAAKGPLAGQFKGLIPDFDGFVRLPELRESLTESEQEPTPNDPDPKLRYAKFFALLDAYEARVTETFNLTTDEEKAPAKEFTAKCKKDLNEFVEEWQPQIVEYLRGYPRIEKDRKDPAKSTVPGMRKQREEIEAKWRALAAPLLPQIDRILDNYEADMNGLAPEAEEGKEKQSVKFKLPGEGPVSVDLVDKYLPIFDMSVGILLMLGLLTPVAGTAAGLFLLSVVLTQFPGSYGAQPTYYQAIEMFGCFVLAFADAGRYAGLDFLPWSFWNRNKASKED
jgi:uncharacterized membrane protein YphA (DoxX/SURF4 family)